MRIEQLKYLVAVADCGSFTAASATLYVAQPSVSQSVAALEKELCVTLLTRTKAGVEPTDIGREIISHARNVLTEIDTIALIAKDELDNGSASIVVAPIVSSTILPMVMSKSSIETIRRIEVIDAVTDKAEHLLERGAADFAIVPYLDIGSVNGIYNFEPLFTAQCMAIVYRDVQLSDLKSISFEEIQKHPISIFSNEYTSYDTVINRISKYGKPNIILKTLIPRPFLTKTMAANLDSVGISFDAGICSNTYIKSGDMKALYIDSPIVLTFGLLYKKDRMMTPLLKELRKQIKKTAEIFREELADFHKTVAGG